MVHVFSKSIDDSHLAFPNLTTTYVDIERVLREEEAVLPERYSKTGYKGVIDEFEAQRWAFYPAMDVLRMGEVNIEEKSILPFFYSAPINVGGTAHVHHFKVDVDLVEHPELRAALEPSRKTDTAIGSEYYEFAVKSYFKEWDDIYKGESQAFRGIRGTRDPRAHGVVKYLGEYSRHLRDDVSGPVREDTRHIMLEFGEQDLEEYLAATKPPVRSKEIIATWEGLFKVASTLRTIHQLDHDWDGDVDRYIGLHGDIKPDNILRVRGKFKLADFGFTSFEKSKIGKPQTSSVLGGTRTYGAPERDQMESTGVKVPHTAAIDTWSLGCVFSAMATWVTLGPQDYINYGERRIMAHDKLQKERNRDAAMHLSVCKDAFHDGTRVLQAVLQWHDYLRNSSRRADTITSRVLDLVENDMLVEDPDDSYLAQFISNRDIIFLVDNASSMDDHWDNVNATLLTLAMKIGMLDKDGLDLMFTIGDPCKHNVSSAKEWKIPEKFGKSMTNAKRDMARYPNNSTDMALALSRVFDNYIDYSKKQTLIVMTDGLWEGSTEEYDVDNTISNFIVKLKTKLDKAERRWFSIQFVSFGDDEKALKRLKRLDDELRSTAKEDVVDSKPWHSTDVNMLILGSIQQGMDAQDPSSPPPPSRVTSQLLANPPPLVTTGSMRKKLVAKLSGR
ncbi:putative serine/threonine-protein kinase MPS1-like protein [Colletotrichum fructicola]|nr:putative serine/threonine-protein kinase MPS1-like protein [Colletotrichum fructicola]